MPYHYEATSEFIQSISEVEKLTTLASSDEENRTYRISDHRSLFRTAFCGSGSALLLLG